MRQVTELKEIQSLATKILKNTKEFCEERKITYYLAYGTLLGAIRHKGFIPWDDDIDVWMKREDFNRFCAEFPEWGKQHGLYVNSVKTTEKYNRVHAQVCLANTRLEANDRTNPFKEGYFVDVFPLDGTPNNSVLRWLHITKLQILKNIVTLSAYGKARKGVVAGIAKGFRNVDAVKVLNLYEKLAQKYNCSDSVYLQMMAPGKKRGRNIVVPSAWFAKTARQTAFGDTTAPTPTGYDDILNCIYGDYMQIPPKEERKPHHDFTLWMEE